MPPGLETLLRVPCDDLFLLIVVEIYEVVAVAGDADQEAAVFVGIRLRVAQRRLARTVGLVVIRARNSVEVAVLDLRGCTIVVSLIYH